MNLTDNDWDTLAPIGLKTTKGGRASRALFQLYSLGIVTNRDEWLYDFDFSKLELKTSFFIKRFNEEKTRWQNSKDRPPVSEFVSRDIKWTSELEAHLKNNKKIEMSKGAICGSLYRPFVLKETYFAPVLTHRPYQNFNFFPNSEAKNTLLVIAVEERVPFSLVATDKLPNKDAFIPSAAQCFARYRYLPDGSRIDNITDWGLKQFRDHYKSATPSPLAGEGGSARSDETDEGAPGLGSEVIGADGDPSSGSSGCVLPQGEKGKSRPARRGSPAKKARPITKDAIFHYVYGLLHDPVYREKYAQNLKREFPRIPFYPDFWQWADWGEKLMELHIGFETVEPWPITRIDSPDARARAAGVAPKPILKSLPDDGVIRLDSETTLSGVPAAAFSYRLGNRSGVDWILDQHKEKTPKDPTIREKFNSYRFADYKEKVVDLLARVTRVSVETMEIVKAMGNAKR